MDLLVIQLKAAIRRLLDSKGVRGRVLDKVNRYGEVVIGVILEQPPASGVAPRDDDYATSVRHAVPQTANAGDPKATSSSAKPVAFPK